MVAGVPHGKCRLTAFLLLALPALLLTMTGCKESAQPLGPRDREGFVALVGVSQDDPLWGVLEATALRHAQGLSGFRVKSVAPALGSPNAQIELLRELHTGDMRGLCIQPADALIMRDILEELRTKGVAVVTLMTSIDVPDRFMHAGVDELAIGKAMADTVYQAVGGEGNIAVLHDGGRTPAHADRYLGFKERIAQLPSVSVLNELDCKGNDFIADRLFSEYMERFPRLNGWVSIADWPLRDLPHRRLRVPRGCALITYGPFPIHWPRIADGACHALIGAEYDRIAENALQMCVTAAKGEQPRLTHYLAPPIVVTRQNLREFKLTWFRWNERPRNFVPQRAVPSPTPRHR